MVSSNLSNNEIVEFNANQKMKNNRLLKLGALFIAAISTTVGAVATAYAPTIIDKICPLIPFLNLCPKDQVAEITRSIGELTRTISKNSDAVTLVIEQLKQQDSDAGTQKLIASLSQQVNSLVLTSQQIGKRAENLGSISQGIISNSAFAKGANLWLPMGTTAFVGDEQNTFGVNKVYDNSNNTIYAALNGAFNNMPIGSKWEFKSASKGVCFVSYFGREGNAFAFGLSCSK